MSFFASSASLMIICFQNCLASVKHILSLADTKILEAWSKPEQWLQISVYRNRELAKLSNTVLRWSLELVHYVMSDHGVHFNKRSAPKGQSHNMKSM